MDHLIEKIAHEPQCARSGKLRWKNLSRGGSRAGQMGPCPQWRNGEHLNLPANDEAHFWLNGYVDKQNCRIWSEANLQVYVETLLHPEKLTVWCTLWAGGILLQKR
ncbi:hypothetical protein TNCV_754951 [Trichonephila clavipes]|nr:hypothetical protein TNCV_754951 [Trichonephila clavipes]